MAETLLFNIPTPAADEDPVVSIHWHQSTNGNTWGNNPVDTILVADLTIDVPTGKYIWYSALADPTKYHQLRTESAIGAINPNGLVVAPLVDRDLCEIYVDVRDIGLLPKAGIVFKLHPRTVGLNGIILDSTPIPMTTGTDGIASEWVGQGGVYELESAITGKPLKIDTTSKTFINIATFFN